MTYEDTHLTPAQLSLIDVNAFDMVMLQDGTAKPLKRLHCTELEAADRPVGATRWRRLVIHVVDVDAPGLQQVLLKALCVELHGPRS